MSRLLRRKSARVKQQAVALGRGAGRVAIEDDLGTSPRHYTIRNTLEVRTARAGPCALWLIKSGFTR